MSKIIIIAVFVFWAAVVFFFASTLFKQDNLAAGNLANSNQLDNTNTDGTEIKSSLAIELLTHDNQNDCWLLISGKIYDVTNYISSHPGGANEIIKYCGTDATKAFVSKDKKNPQDHSAAAYAMLKDYYIGEATSISASANTNANFPTNSNESVANNSQNTNTPSPVSYTLTTALVAQHNTASDCWATVGNNVYNVTSYIRSHPGGQANITRYCGADIGAAFVAQGHSANASNILASYKIGTIGASVSADTINTNPVNNSNNNQNSSDDDEEEEEDD
jgi:cytochrome b involved in lipid metabolism